MARIVCQALHRADRITFIWSDGEACFEPYHLEGQERADLLAIADKIHAAIADDSASELPDLGRQLYRVIFRADAPDAGAAPAVRAWLTQWAEAGNVERIEFISDLPGRIPWNLLTEEPTAGFWGARFAIGAARRVNPLRANLAQVNPTLLAAADDALARQAAAEQQASLASLRGDGRLCSSATSLADALKTHTPDILFLLVRFSEGRMHLGHDAFDSADLQAWLAEAREGNPDPLVLLLAWGDASGQAAWLAELEAASAAFSGLVANEVLLPAGHALQVGLQVAQRYVQGDASLGEILRDLRKVGGPAAVAFSAFCPPQLCVVKEGAEAPPPELVSETTVLPPLPYRPFAPYDAGDRALFFGREEDTIRAAVMVDGAQAGLVLLHGSPAVGKTSFLQAGLLPYLEQDGVGYRALRDRTAVEGAANERDYPVLILRCTHDLAGQFADALSVFCVQALTYTTPTGTQVTVDLPGILKKAVAAAAPSEPSTAIQAAELATGVAPAPLGGDDEPAPSQQGVSARDLWIALRDDPGRLGVLLDAITRFLPFELVIAVDQGEELLTQARSTQQKARRDKALAMLLRLSKAAPRCKIVFAIRSQSLGQFTGLLPAGKAPADWTPFYLRPLTQAEMVDALMWPTNRDTIPYCDVQPHERYHFSFEEGLAQQIVSEAIDAAGAEQQSPLALVQASGALLYQTKVLARNQDVIRAGDLKDAGRVQDALDKCLDLALEQMPLAKITRTALRELIAKLAVSHADGTVSRDLVAAGELRAYWNASAEPMEATVNLAAEQQGLFDIQQLLIGGQTDLYVSLPQDSLARLGKKITAERQSHARARTAVIDLLWIMIPLTFLAAAITFYFTRRSAGPSEEAVEKQVQAEINKLNEEHERAIASSERQIRVGRIAQADQALRAGEALRARRLLAFADGKDDAFPVRDGFDWKYLSRQLDGARFALTGHRDSVLAVAVSPDGKRAASTGADGAIRVWDLESGKLLASIAGAKIPVHAVAFAPDNRTLASAGGDKLVRLWDLADLKAGSVGTLKETKTLKGHEAAVYALAFAKDAGTIASAGADKSVVLWDIAAGKALHTFKDHAAAVRALGITSDGKTLVSAGDDGQLALYDVDKVKRRFLGKTAYSAIAALAISPDGKTLATGGVEAALGVERGVIRFWNLADGKQTHKPVHHGAAVLALAFAPDGKDVVSGGKDFVIRMWNVEKGEQTRRWLAHFDAVNGLAFAKDGSAFVSGGGDQAVKVWDPARSAGPEVVPAHAAPVRALALDAKATLLASGAQDGTIKLFDPKSGKLATTLPDHPGAVTALTFSKHKDATFLAVGTRDDKDAGLIKIWRIDGDAKKGVTAKEVHAFKDHQKGVTCLAFHPAAEKADLLLSGSADRTVKVWDIKTGKDMATYAGHKDEVRCVAFSSDGAHFASGGKDALLCFYRLGRAEIQKFGDLHRAPIEAIALFTLGEGDEGFTAIVTGSADRTIAFWGYDPDHSVLEKPKLFRTFEGHSQPVTRVAHVGPNHAIFSSSSDGTVNFHDLFGQRLTFMGGQGPVRAIAVAADQSLLVSAGDEGTIRFWRADAPRGPIAQQK